MPRAPDLGFTRDRYLICASRLRPTCDGTSSKRELSVISGAGRTGSPAFAGDDSKGLFLLAHFIEPLLHLVELALELVHFATAALRLVGRFAVALRERREHGESLLEHLHVPPHLILERAETADTEGLRHLFAEFALLAGERVDGSFEEARHHHLHAVAVEPDQLPQEGDRQKALAFLVFLLENDLREHGAGDVVAALGVIDDKIFAVLHHRRQVF